MNWTGNLQQYLEIKPEIIAYCESGGYTNIEEVFFRLNTRIYEPRFFKRRINSAIKGASEQIEGKHRPRNSQLVLKDIYEYKQYKKRNENESKNEDKTTGNR
tara:strand:+ start:480 stop:785 length:306 start_codon:yes stop_codon:yes gene_type:complete